MTPPQAAAAGSILATSAICPIHYGMINTAPIYVEYPNVREALTEAALARQLPVTWLQPGETVELQ